MLRPNRLERPARLEAAASKSYFSEIELSNVLRAPRVEVDSGVDGRDFIKADNVNVPNSNQVVEKLTLYAPLDGPTFSTLIRLAEGTVTYSIGVEDGKLFIRKGMEAVACFEP